MSRERGFTLIELMIVVVIIGILSMIAIPAYSDYVRRTRAAEAVAELSAMTVKLEQHFQDHRSYVGACASNSVAKPVTSTKGFDFPCVAANYTATGYLFEAVGKANMAGFTYSVQVTNNGAPVRSTTLTPAATTATGWVGNSACWVLRKGGDCS
ncbi:MAG: prepilin-type N-terminal cleavage/methylation domain-containing protein [Burkholderiaceae bacterium]|nr:prepilin-type N-terminal cleavage/methylation domain-containing protein [Burkholderiales bacterium]MBP7566730.1 prepilin-type N-terminal cleavage/methylation domain-containing protein [Burkholderiaceae bacterium]